VDILISLFIILVIPIMAFLPHLLFIILDTLITVSLGSVRSIILGIPIMVFLLLLGARLRDFLLTLRSLTRVFLLVASLLQLIRHFLRLLEKMPIRSWSRSMSHKRDGLQRLMIM
jgi:hypothetical protein